MGVSSYLWYYAPSLGLITVCAALGAAELSGRRVGALTAALAVVAGAGIGLQTALGVPWALPGAVRQLGDVGPVPRRGGAARPGRAPGTVRARARRDRCARVRLPGATSSTGSPTTTA